MTAGVHDMHRPRTPRRPSRAARATRALLAGLAAALAATEPSRAAPPADVLPFRLLYGRPAFVNEGGVTCFLWSEGGRLHLRLLPDRQAPHRVRGELRTSKAGAFRDVTPSSEDLQIRQAKPSKLEFETRTGRKEEGLDVTLGGDFNQLTVDLMIDDARHPDALRIGERRERPRGLPARLDVKGADPSWIQRFGFRP